MSAFSTKADMLVALKGYQASEGSHIGIHVTTVGGHIVVTVFV
jgi:hypothetical protein